MKQFSHEIEMDSSVEKIWGKYLSQDPTLITLILSNILTIFIALVEHWSLLSLMWVYWTQSVTIGIFNFIRIMQLKEFSTEGFQVNDKQPEPTENTKISTAFFFLFHYGFFHLVYCSFLLSGNFAPSGGWHPGSIEFICILLTALIFFVNHLYSYIYNSDKYAEKQNIGSLMFYPYARIIPLHMTIMFSSFTGGALVFFIVLKTVADAIMHIWEQKLLIKGVA